MWFSLVAKQQSDLAQQKSEEAKKQIGRLATEMTPEQMVEARRLCEEWKPKK